MTDKKYTPALGMSFLTPLYDVAVSLATRENTWRRRLVRLVDPRPGDRILDVGCGTGTLAIRLYRREPGASITGLDPDPDVLALAGKKADKANSPIRWIEGFLNTSTATKIGTVTKIVSSLVLHQTPVKEKKRILATMHDLLEPDGLLVIGDFGLQRTWLMRALFRCTVQVFDGVADTQPNADGCLPDLMREAGFRNIQERDVINTATGSISLYSALK